MNIYSIIAVKLICTALYTNYTLWDSNYSKFPLTKNTYIIITVSTEQGKIMFKN